MGSQRFGTSEEGFELGIGDDARVLHIRMWGFWSIETSRHFSSVVIGACASMQVSTVTIDAANLKPLRDVGQDAFGSVLASLPMYKVCRVLLTAAGPLTRLQLLRIAKERAHSDLLQVAS
jgi:hypothetical protein